MRPFALAPDDVTSARIDGAILCHDIVAAGETGRVKLSKGRRLTARDAEVLRGYGGEIHLLELEPGDVHEDEASVRLARAAAGLGIELRGPVESQTTLRAGHRGIVRVRADLIEEVNNLPDVSVFTSFDGQPVAEGRPVAAAKVTPLAVPGEVIDRAEAILAAEGPAVEVLPFLGRPVGVVARDRVAGSAREKFEAAVRMKVGWFGSPVAGITYPEESVEAVASAIDVYVSAGAGLVLAAGVNSTDPLDLTIQALDRLGATTERRGVPAHPGSTCWLAYVGETPIFGLALCGMFSKTTVLDLLLPRFLSGRRVTAADVAQLGHGGLLGKEMAFRFPDYAHPRD